MKQIQNEQDYVCASNEKTQIKLKNEKHKKFFDKIKFYVNPYIPDDTFGIYDSKHPLTTDLIIFKVVEDELLYVNTIKSGFKYNYEPYTIIKK